MAIAAAAVWEIRHGAGADTNGGAFVTGASGTDLTQQDAAAYSVTDGVTAGSTTITSATANFGTDVVGNIMYVQGGTGSVVAGWYQITARGSATSITVDRSTGLTAGTGVTLKIGGGLASIQKAFDLWVAYNTGYVKGNATLTASATQSAANATPGSGGVANRLIGYTTTRTDNGRPVLTLSGSSLTALNLTAFGFWIRNFEIDCANQTASIGIASSYYGKVSNCIVRRFTGKGIDISTGQDQVIFGNEVKDGTSAATAAILDGNSHAVIENNDVHGNACPGIVSTGGFGTAITGNRVYANTGASSDGILTIGGPITGNTCYANGRDGIRTSTYAIGLLIRNNISYGNSGYQLNLTSTAIPADPAIDYNALGSGGSGARNGSTANGHDVALSADPFVNAASGNFSLNNTAGGGAACRAAGIQGRTPAGTTTGYPDIGAAQHNIEVQTAF